MEEICPRYQRCGQKGLWGSLSYCEHHHYLLEAPQRKSTLLSTPPFESKRDTVGDNDSNQLPSLYPPFPGVKQEIRCVLWLLLMAP